MRIFMMLTKISIAITVLFLWSCSPVKKETKTVDSELTSLSIIENAARNGSRNIQVHQTGKIVAILKDDLEGNRHQRFIVKLSNGQTILIAHNIDMAPRVRNLEIGKSVTFYGEYEGNSKGGIIHWTHKDQGGKHIGGWIEYEGVKYE